VDRSEIAKRFARDRHFCTRLILQGCDEARAGFITREHGRHPRLVGQGAWCGCGRTETGQVREQLIEVAGVPAPWRRIELALDMPTEAGERVIRLWSNLPEAVGAGQIATLHRTRWRVERSRSPGIEGMFQRLESVLNSEIRSLGHPRAALLGFAVAVLAYNVLALLQRCVEQAHREQEPPPEVSTYHLALHVRGDYEGMLIALPPEQWRSYDGDPTGLADRLCSWHATSIPARSPRASADPRPPSPRDTPTAPPHGLMSPPHAYSPRHGQRHLERGAIDARRHSRPERKTSSCRHRP
jgi:hypothetical protein